MNYRDPQLQARLAADYVSGAMRGGARRRFEGLMMADAALRREVQEWQDDIFPLAWSLPPQMPPSRVWRAIRARVRGVSAFSWGWDGLYSWRLLSGALTVVLIAGAIVLPRQMEQAMLREQRMAVLHTEQARALIVVRVDADGILHARTLQDLNTIAGSRAFELWALRPNEKPRSLGMVATNGNTALARRGQLAGVDQLAITLEPPGGSPTGQATGPIVMTGKLLEI